MARLTNASPRMAQPKLPASLVEQLDVIAKTFDLPRARVLRVILRECLADAALRDRIVAEIERQHGERIRGELVMVNAAIPPGAEQAFAELMATTGSGSSAVARAVLVVACEGRLARFKKALIAEGAMHDDMLERQRARVLAEARRLGMELVVNV